MYTDTRRPEARGRRSAVPRRGRGSPAASISGPPPPEDGAQQNGADDRWFAGRCHVRLRSSNSGHPQLAARRTSIRVRVERRTPACQGERRSWSVSGVRPSQDGPCRIRTGADSLASLARGRVRIRRQRSSLLTVVRRTSGPCRIRTSDRPVSHSAGARPDYYRRKYEPGALSRTKLRARSVPDYPLAPL